MEPDQGIIDELQRMVDAGLPGAFVYVDDADGGAAFATAGVADLASGRAMNAEQHYRVGSTTKTFTAVVILQLVTEDRLTLSDLVAHHLAGHAVPHGETLTIEHLLRMRSGLFDFEDHPSLLGNVAAHQHPHSLAEVLAFGLEGPPAFQPGGRFAYCNTNYVVLEAVVERVTGRPLSEELAARVMGPLGLEQTIYPDENDLSLPEPCIRGYDRDPSGWVDVTQQFFGRGDGALISTVGDLSRFFRALLGGRLLPAALLDRMRTVLPSDPPARLAYGMGLIADPVASGIGWGHSGGGFGYYHLPFLDPRTGRFAICMRNGTAGFRAGLAEIPDFSAALRSLAYPG